VGKTVAIVTTEEHLLNPDEVVRYLLLEPTAYPSYRWQHCANHPNMMLLLTLLAKLFSDSKFSVILRKYVGYSVPLVVFLSLFHPVAVVDLPHKRLF